MKKITGLSVILSLMAAVSITSALPPPDLFLFSLANEDVRQLLYN